MDDPDHRRLCAEITCYDKEAENWNKRAKKILKRYKDERSPREERLARYNILWSNLQTLLPATYSQDPKPRIERRNKDQDDLGRITADVWERTVAYYIDQYGFSSTMRQAVFDRLAPGRGTVWVRYVPHMRDMAVQGNQEVKDEGSQITDDAEIETEQEATPAQEVYYEETCTDYVHWEDFGHNVARTWEEVNIVWRKAYLTREELVERFGEELGKAIPLDYTPRGLSDEKVNEELKKATIYEIWDKQRKEAFWIHITYPKVLDRRSDPLRLKDFFPCPRPLYPHLANDSLIPVPDFVQYQDQAAELDNLTSRINAITKSLKVVGIYDASAEGVQRILAEGVENQLIPVEQYAVLAEKGGLKGVVELLPVKEIAEVLIYLYEAREKVLQDIYQITGIADIVRGSTKANETATAQQIKGQFATLRLDDMQDEVQRFARDVICIMAEIIAEHFSIDTIKKVCGMKLFTQQEKQMKQGELQQAQMQAQATGQPAPPIPDELQEMLQNPTWEEVEALLRDDAMRGFLIDIETNSTIKMDEESERAARIELLTAAGGFLQQAMQINKPELVPLLGQMLLFGVRGFSVGKQLEGAFQLAINKLEKQAEQPQQAQPNPDMIKVQAEIENNKSKLQLQQQDMQGRMQLEQQKSVVEQQSEERRAALEFQLEQAKAQNELILERERMQAEMQLKREIEILKIVTQAQATEMQMQIDKEAGERDSENEAKATETAQPDMKSMMEPITEAVKVIGEYLKTPRKISATTSSGKKIEGEVSAG